VVVVMILSNGFKKFVLKIIF